MPTVMNRLGDRDTTSIELYEIAATDPVSEGAVFDLQPQVGVKETIDPYNQCINSAGQSVGAGVEI